MNRRYLIWAPPFCGSAGVRALYKLATELREHGQSVSLWSWGDTRQPGFDYAESITPQMREEDIVVYPEVVAGNPLQMRNVVRWVLFFPGRNGGESNYHPSEKIFTWKDNYYPGAPKLTVDIIDRELFFDAGLPRTRDCTFIHKGNKWKNVPELDGLTEITMEWPKTRTELAQLLQTTNTLYSWDNCSTLLEEAILCGVSVKIITDDGFCNFHPIPVSSQESFEKEFSFFIHETQSMHYKGELQPLNMDILQKIRLTKLKIHIWHTIGKLYSTHFVYKHIMYYHNKLKSLGYYKLQQP